MRYIAYEQRLLFWSNGEELAWCQMTPKAVATGAQAQALFRQEWVHLWSLLGVRQRDYALVRFWGAIPL